MCLAQVGHLHDAGLGWLSGLPGGRVVQNQRHLRQACPEAATYIRRRLNMKETKMSHNPTEDQLKAALLALKGAVRDRAIAHLPEIAVQQSNGSWQISNAVPAPMRKALKHLISFRGPLSVANILPKQPEESSNRSELS